jgi:Zn ribbon nucleic-acid-binding protein
MGFSLTEKAPRKCPSCKGYDFDHEIVESTVTFKCNECDFTAKKSLKEVQRTIQSESTDLVDPFLNPSDVVTLGQIKVFEVLSTGKIYQLESSNGSRVSGPCGYIQTKNGKRFYAKRITFLPSYVKIYVMGRQDVYKLEELQDRDVVEQHLQSSNRRSNHVTLSHANI